MVLYNENTQLDLEKFDIYNQYRDQVCYITIDKKVFDIPMEPKHWEQLENIVQNKDLDEQVKLLDDWFKSIVPDNYGEGKAFEFNDKLLKRILLHLKDKFD